MASGSISLDRADERLFTSNRGQNEPTCPRRPRGTPFQGRAAARPIVWLPRSLRGASIAGCVGHLRIEFERYGEESSTLLKRMALVVRDGRIEQVFYPVFRPDRNAADIMEWLRTNA